MERFGLLVLCLSAFFATIQGHEPLTNGTSTGPDWSTWNSALLIPNNKFSLSAKRLSTAKGPVFWLKWTPAAAGQLLTVGTGSGIAVANAQLRTSVFVFGRGLPIKYRAAQFKVPVPVGTGWGYRAYRSPRSVSNCRFLTTANGKQGNAVITYNGVTRCGSRNNVTGTGFFPMIDNVFKAPTATTYYFAVFLDATWEAAWYFSTGSTVHGHDENHSLPVPPMGNARHIDTAWANLTVTSMLGGVNILPFTILK